MSGEQNVFSVKYVALGLSLRHVFLSLSSHLLAKIFQVQPRCLSAQTDLGEPHAHLQGRGHAVAGLPILRPQDVRL